MKWRDRPPQLADELARLRTLEPHELLAVPAGAPMEAVKRAYRQLAKVYHPDTADPFMRAYNEQVLKMINDAYAKLTGK